MINFNGDLIPSSKFRLTQNNRAFKYGDAIFDTLKVFENNIYFIEDHYFRLMSSMRMLRMEIPMNFNLNYYKAQIEKTIEVNELSSLARVRLTVFRKDGGLYAPKTQEVDFIIEAQELKLDKPEEYEIELFKDFPIVSGLLSTIKTNNKMLSVLGSIFAEENGYQNAILINEKKNLVEANNANLFLVKGNQVITAPLTEGCLNGILRKQIIAVTKKMEGVQLIERPLAPIELLQADEVFLTNSILDIQSVTKYRKKEYTQKITKRIEKEFNNLLADQIAV